MRSYDVRPGEGVGGWCVGVGLLSIIDTARAGSDYARFVRSCVRVRSYCYRIARRNCPFRVSPRRIRECERPGETFTLFVKRLRLIEIRSAIGTVT